MNSWMMAVGVAALFALYGLRCTRVQKLRDRAWLTAGLSLILASVFALVLARVSYALLMLELDFEYDGLEALLQLLELRIENVSFFGGAVGVCLGVALANRLLHKGSVLAGLDAFAPFGALLIALFRINESFYGSYGAGASVPEGSILRCFPFALWIEVDGNYGYYAWAICLLSAALAIVWSVFALVKLRNTTPTGKAFTSSLFFLALYQVLCESMRRRGMFWLFVHVEQLLCAVVLFGVLLYWIITAREKAGLLQQWAPLAVFAACVGLIVATEFAIDGKLFDFAPSVCYVFMLILLSVIGAAGLMAAKRWCRAR